MLLTFNSATATKIAPQNRHDDFEVQINPPLNLGPNAKAALVKYNGYYSWHNITSESENHRLRYSSDNGHTFQDVVFENGLYSYEDINHYLEFAVKPALPPSIKFQETTYKVKITVPENCILDLRTSNFAQLLGYLPIDLVAGEYTSPNPPNLSQDLDTLFIHCDFIKDSIVDGSWGNILHSFTTANLVPGYPFSQEPRNLMYLPTSSQTISRARIYLTDVYKRPVCLNAAPVTIVISIKDD
jgi:hypothetical protein